MPLGFHQSVFTGFLGLLGLQLFVFYKQHGALPDVSSDKLSAYFALTELPAGVAGALVAAVLGSTMSVFSGGINAAATSV